MEFAVDLLWEEEPFSEQVKGRFRKAVMNLKNTLRDQWTSLDASQRAWTNVSGDKGRFPVIIMD